MKILLIDDDAGFCQLTQKLLTKQGYAVDVFHEAESGIKYARENKPNLILMDIMLPGISGPEMVGSLKIDPQFKDVPIVFITALVTGDENGLEDQGIMVGETKYQTLGKPYKVERLLAVVKQYAG